MAHSPTPPGLSSELSSLLQRVAAFDAVAAERDDALRQLANTTEALRIAETQAAGFGDLSEQKVALEAEVKALRAQLAMAEEESRRARPMRDALVRELQVRPASRRTPRQSPTRSQPPGPAVARRLALVPARSLARCPCRRAAVC